jgi:hypothetical protein
MAIDIPWGTTLHGNLCCLGEQLIAAMAASPKATKSSSQSDSNLSILSQFTNLK